MRRHVEVTFRGLVTDVVVDQYSPDAEFGTFECEWHFDGLTPEESADLHVTGEEDDAILEQISRSMHDDEVTVP